MYKGKVIEEDWSNFMPGIDDIYATHELEKIRVSRESEIEILSISPSQMTPLDIVNSISEEGCDASCHMIWLGSQLFVDVMFRPLFPPQTTSEETYDRINNLRQFIFDGSEKRVIELGCGTGLAGLAFLAGYLEMRRKSILPSKPITMFLTDSDPEATRLCRKNFERNFESQEDVNFTDQVLVWGEEWWDKENESNNGLSLQQGSFDIVIGADVVYDLDVLPLFMKTSSEALSNNGLLILSHVPRFAIAENVESLILKHAENHGLFLYDKVYPDVLVKSNFYDKLVEKEGVLMAFQLH